MVDVYWHFCVMYCILSEHVDDCDDDDDEDDYDDMVYEAKNTNRDVRRRSQVVSEQ